MRLLSAIAVVIYIFILSAGLPLDAVAAPAVVLGPEVQPSFTALMDEAGPSGVLGPGLSISRVEIEPERAVVVVAGAGDGREHEIRLLPPGAGRALPDCALFTYALDSEEWEQGHAAARALAPTLARLVTVSPWKSPGVAAPGRIGGGRSGEATVSVAEGESRRLVVEVDMPSSLAYGTAVLALVFLLLGVCAVFIFRAEIPSSEPSDR